MTYEYKAAVERWVDGDTVELTVDLGFHMTMRDHFRLLGIDTPERGRPGAAEAKARSNELAPVDTLVTIVTTKADKYGRWLADVINGAGENVSGVLLAEKLAKPYFGGTKDVS